jgi:glycosyltransferase involved in cell wall biosynthesis
MDIVYIMTIDDFNARGRRIYKICEIVRHAEIAGTEKHVSLLASNLDKRYFEVHVCTFEYGSLITQLDKQKIKTQVIKTSKILHFLKLVLYLHRNNFNIVHCHSGGYACVAAKFAGCKNIIYTKHGIGVTRQELFKRNFIYKLRSFLVDICVTKYVALTECDKKLLVNIMRISNQKIDIIPNGIDPSSVKKFSRKKSATPIIGVVGRLVKQKGISYLIEAIPTIVGRYKNLKIIIAGSGEDYSSLKNLAERLGVSRNISFLGYVNDPLKIINKMDVFVLPSIWEGFPYVLLEAMLLKKPIVATNIFGVNEIVTHNKSGILVRTRDPQCMADAVIVLLTDKRKASKFGNSGYQKLLRNYTLKRTISKLETAYIDILEKGYK